MKAPVSRLDRVIHGLLMVVAAVFIPLALVVGVGRELMPLVAQHRTDVEQLLSRQTGLRIETSELTGDWHRLSPVLTVRQLRIYANAQAKEPALVVPELRATPDWWASLRDWGLRLRTDVDGLQLTLSADAQGRLGILEFADLGESDPARTQRTVQWLLAQPGLSLSNYRLRWQAPGAPVQLLRDVRIQQYRRGQDYRLEADFRLGDGQAWQRAMVRVDGDPLAWRNTPWQAWLQVDDLAAWQPWLGLLPQRSDLQLRGGRAALWLSSAQGLPTTATVSLEAVGLSAEIPGRGRYEGDGLTGVVSLRRNGAQGWQLSADDLAGRVNDMPLPLQRVAIDYQPDAVLVAAARLSLAGAQAWLARERLLPDAIRPWLDSLQPQGWLPRLQISLKRVDKDWQLADISSEFKALSVLTSRDYPGASHLAGWFHGTPAHGLLFLDTRHAELDLRQVFREKVPVDLLRGGIRWQHADGIWHIDSDSLSLVNADADAHAQLALRIPDARPQDATLDLLAGLSNARVDRAWRYVPWQSAGDDTLAWLQRALRAGTVEQGRFLHSGRIAGPGAGSLDMQFDLKGASIDYVPDWPALEAIDGRVSIIGGRLSVTADKARIMDSDARNIVAVIPDLRHAVLSVDADLDMDLAALDKLMAESPMRASTAETARRLALSGPAQAHLGLVVPLAGGDVDVTVAAQVKGATIGLPEERLEFTQVSGPVRFDTRRGLDAEALRASLWGQPMQVALAGVARGSSWWQQKVTVDGPVDAAALGRWLDVDMTRYARGSTPARIGLNLSVASPAASELRINSSLQGWRLPLPAPLDKPAAAVWPLAYRGALGHGEQAGSLTLAGIARAGLLWRDGALQRLHLQLGGNGAASPDQPGTVIDASLGTLDIALWQRFLRQQTSAGGHAGTETLPPLRQVSLSADRVLVGGETLGASKAQIRRSDKGWDIALKGLQPASRPAWPVTEVDADLSISGNQWQLAPLVVRQPLATFTGSLAWQDALRSATTLKGQLEARDLARILEQFGQPALISSDTISAKGELRWSGLPDDFTLATLDGSIEAGLKSGRIRDVNGLSPAARIFGLINASNIMRRLRLDFTDITRKGLNFDQITVQGDLQDGVARNSRFDMDGPSMSIRGRGWVNFNTRELDQQLRIGVPVSSAVPVVAGFLAGPIIGGALVAADLLFDKQLSRLTSVRYRVSGPWDNLKLDDEALESQPAPTGKSAEKSAEKPAGRPAEKGDKPDAAPVAAPVEPAP